MTTPKDAKTSTARTIAIGAVSGVAAGLLANIARKAAVQAPTVLAGNWDVALAAEHAAALKIFDLLEKTTDEDPGKRATLLAQLKHAVGKHAWQEENVVYTMMRDHGLTEAADHLNHEHGYVKQYFFELTELPKTDPAWLPKLAEFRALIEKHMEDEERDLFPRLRAQLSDAQNSHVTAMMNKEGLRLA